MAADRPHQPTLILASRSPRRGSLLREAGYSVVQRAPAFEDPPHPEAQENDGDSAAAVAMQLAEAKARSVPIDDEWAQLDDLLVIAADTIVVDAAGHLLGQPVDVDDARRVIASLVNARHDVVTGVALFDPLIGACETFADTAVVYVGPVDDASIEAYLATGQWQGKAGGYNLFERRPHWPLKVDGDETTVVGLPMTALRKALEKRGITAQTRD